MSSRRAAALLLAALAAATLSCSRPAMLDESSAQVSSRVDALRSELDRAGFEVSAVRTDDFSCDSAFAKDLDGATNRHFSFVAKLEGRSDADRLKVVLESDQVPVRMQPDDEDPLELGTSSRSIAQYHVVIHNEFDEAAVVGSTGCREGS